MSAEAGAWGVRHVDAYGWDNVQEHKDLESAKEDLSTCGWNCSIVKRGEDEKWAVVDDENV